MGSAYFLSDSVTVPPLIESKKLVKYCSEKRLELLIGSDANTHHTVWGSSDVNPRGGCLCKYLMAQGLLVQNKGEAPTFIKKVRQGVLDITIYRNWFVVEGCLTSLHYRTIDTSYTGLVLLPSITERTSKPYRHKLEQSHKWTRSQAELSLVQNWE